MRKILIALGITTMIFVFVAPVFGQEHHICYGGYSFTGRTNTGDYHHIYGYVYKPSSPGYLDCGVNFPDSANGMQVTRVSVTFLDDTLSGYIEVQLIKVDRWTGNYFIVADLYSGMGNASSSVSYMNIPKVYMTAYGIDNTRYSWALRAEFTETGSNLRLYQVTIRYE